MHDVIYEAESALCNINKHHLQLKIEKLLQKGDLVLFFAALQIMFRNTQHWKNYKGEI